jgi:hypothetical protein
LQVLGLVAAREYPIANTVVEFELRARLLRSLVGPGEKIRDDLERWRESIVTTLLVSGVVTTLRAATELVLE